MNLLAYLDQVRSQPEPVRRRLALAWSIVLTGLVVVIWLLNVWLLSPPPSAQEGSGRAEAPAPAHESFFNSVKLRIQLGWQALTE